jgi:hypothetical protein
MCFNTYFLIFVFLMHYSIFLINIYILESVGHILTWAKTQVKRKKNPTLLGSFKVSSKTQVNTVSDKKKAPWQKYGSVFQRFLAVLYSVAFDV